MPPTAIRLPLYAHTDAWNRAVNKQPSVTLSSICWSSCMHKVITIFIFEAYTDDEQWLAKTLRAVASYIARADKAKSPTLELNSS